MSIVAVEMNASEAKMFKHPRRLLFLAPLALLGAALLVRARLPRPQTEGDKWLWEQAEQAPALTISYRDAEEDYKDSIASGGFNVRAIRTLTVSDRHGMRYLLRALKDTPPFTSLSHRSYWPIDYEMNLGDAQFCITHRGGHSFLYRGDSRIAPLSPSALTRFQEVFHAALLKARQHQKGYNVGVFLGSVG